MRYLEHPRAEVGRMVGLCEKTAQSIQKGFDTDELQGRAEPAGEELPALNQQADLSLRYSCAPLQIALHERFIKERQLLLYLAAVKRGAKIQKTCLQRILQLLQHPRAIRAGLIHLVDEENYGDAVAL